MNDTVNAIIQLNGDITGIGNAPQLDEREPYLLKQDKGVYMYVGMGVDSDNASLRTSEADHATLASTAECVRNNTLFVGEYNDDQDNGPVVYIAGSNDEMALPYYNQTKPSVRIRSGYILGGGPANTVNAPVIKRFNMELWGHNEIFAESANGARIRNLALEDVPKIKLVDGKTYGDKLPTTAEIGQVFFLVV